MESLKVIICRSCGDYAQDEVDAELYLVKQAGPKPQSDISIGRPDGQGPCTKKILFLLKEREVVERGELREEIVELGYQRNTFCNAMRALVKQGKIVLIGPPQSCHQKVSLNSNA